MILNHSHGFAFVHVPQTHSTVVARMLRRLCNYRDVEIGTGAHGADMQDTYGRHYGLDPHAPAQRIRQVMGDADWADYFTFGFVQNPFSRLVSIYDALCVDTALPASVARGMARFETVEDFLNSDVWSAGGDHADLFQPQSAWLTAPDDPKALIVDFVGRQETLEDDMDRVGDGIGGRLCFDTRQFVDPAAPPRAPIHWTEATVRRVLMHYRADFELFGYADKPAAGTDGIVDYSPPQRASRLLVPLSRDVLAAHRKVVRRAPEGWDWVVVEDRRILVHPTLGGRASVVALDVDLASSVAGFSLTADSPNAEAPEIEIKVAIFPPDVPLKLDARLPDPLPDDLAETASDWQILPPGTQRPIEIRRPMGCIGPLQLVLASRAPGPTVDFGHCWFQGILALTKA